MISVTSKKGIGEPVYNCAHTEGKSYKSYICILLLTNIFLIGCSFYEKHTLTENKQNILRMKSDKSLQLKYFVISVWGGPSLEKNIALYDALPQIINKLHINTVMCRIDKLELCRTWGFKALLLDATPEIIKEIKNDEKIWGYHIADEPKQNSWEKLSYIIKKIKDIDSQHPCYINLGGSLQKDNPNFIEKMNPDILSFDYYPWSWGHSSFFSRLEEYRRGALKAGIPLFSWVSSVTTATPEERLKNADFFPNNNYERLSYVVYSNLAYGVKGIQWFHGQGIWGRGTDVRLSTMGQDIAKINLELSSIGSQLINLKSVDVFHSTPLPEGTRTIPEDYYVQINGKNWLLGIFKDPLEKKYLLIVNRDIQQNNSLILNFKYSIPYIDIYQRSQKRWVRKLPQTGLMNYFNISINPADCELIRLP